MRSTRWVLCALILLASQPGFAANHRMIGLNFTSGILYDVDTLTGAASNPRPTVLSGLGGLAISPGGDLYAIRHHVSDYSLYEIDRHSGTPSLVGITGLTIIEGGLDFHPTSGVLYGVKGRLPSGGPTGLFTLDTVTGAATLVGPITISSSSVDVSGLAFDDLGTLYALRTVASASLLVIDPLTATVLSETPLVGFPTAGAGIGGLEFNPDTGVLYGLLHSGTSLGLMTIAPGTGVMSLIGSSAISGAIEFVPQCCDADVDSSGSVDLTDLGIVTSCLGQTPVHGHACEPADINCDGFIDLVDSEIVVCNIATPGSPACCPATTIATPSPGAFCIIGPGDGSDWSWQVDTNPPVTVPGPSPAAVVDLRDAYVNSINASGIAALSCAAGPGSACFTVTFPTSFQFWVGAPGGPASCLVSGSPAGCPFNPMIYEEAYFPPSLPGLTPDWLTAGAVALTLGVTAIARKRRWKRHPR